MDGQWKCLYFFDLNDAWRGFVRADFNHYGESFAQIMRPLPQIRKRDSWEALNLRAVFMNEKYELTVFADNVTDERANLADNRSIAAKPLVVAFGNESTTIGLEGRIRF